MDFNSFDSVCIDSTIDFLQSDEREYERYGSFPHSESCPSLPSSFVTIDTSRLSIDDRRRGSTSPDNFTASSASVTSPITPLGHIPMHSFYAPEAWSKTHSHDLWQTQKPDPESFWMVSGESAMANCVMNSFPQHTLATLFQPGYFCPTAPSKGDVDPPLSRAVFNNVLSDSKATNPDEMVAWSNMDMITHPQTVEPNATFQTTLPSSSPLSKYEPITPLRHQRGSSSFFASSPLSGGSSILASQWGVDDMKYTPDDEVHSHAEKSFFRRTLQSSRGSSRIKMEDESSRKSFPSKSGVDCDAVIQQNKYACSRPGCHQRFKRQEHRKRHEKTVHAPPAGVEQLRFPCWVITGNKVCGRSFTRRDNLKSHETKTHGKRSHNQRNAYVATLDPKSKYYDAEWAGPLTAEGLPIGHPSFPEIC